MQIRQVKTRADRRAFIGLPARLYADLPLWVPPLHRDERFMMSRRHPFYRHSEAAFFVVEDEREVVGRLAVLDHHRWMSTTALATPSSPCSRSSTTRSPRESSSTPRRHGRRAGG